MTIHLGKVKPGTTLYIPFDTFAGSTGASITMTGLAVTDIEIYKNGSTTQRASDTGYTLLDTDGIDFDALTGIHGFSVDLSSNADSGFFVAGGFYWVVVSAITVDSQTVSFVAATFSIGYEGSVIDTTIATLASQTSFTLTAGPAEDDALNGCAVVIHDIASAVQAGRAIVSDYTGSTKTVTLVAATTFTAAAGDNISVMLSALQPTTQGRTLDVSAGGESGVDWANVGTPGSTVGLTATTVATVTTTGTATNLTNAPTNGDLTATMKTSVTTAATAATPTAAAVTGAVGSVTGNVGGNVVGSVGSVTGAVGSVTGNVGGNVAGSVASVTAGVTVTTNNDKTGYGLSSAAVQAIWDALTSALTTVGSIGKKLADWVTGTAQTGDTYALANGANGFAAIKSDTAAILVDTGTTLDGRIPAALVGGRMDASVGAMAANTLTASAVAADAVTEIQAGLSTLTTGDIPTAAANADAVWDEAIAGHLGAGSTGAALNAATAPSAATVADAVWDEAIAGHLSAGSTGLTLNSAGSAGDPWSTALPGAYGAGTAGKIVGDNLNATVSSRSSHSAADVWASAARTLTAATNITSTGGTTVPQTGDSFARIGAAGAGLTALGDARIANLDAAVTTRAVAGDAMALTAGERTTLTAAIWAYVVEGTHTAVKLMRLFAAALAGKLSGAATATNTIRDIDDTKNRIVATVDADGNRTAITLDES